MTDSLLEAVARAIYELSPFDTPNGWHDEMPTARAALAAIEQSGTHVVVPKTPTPAMLVHASGFRTGEHIYAAFLSASPKQEDAT